MKKKLVYISSRYLNGNQAENVAIQLDIAHKIMDLGGIPIVPHLHHFLHIHKQRPYEEWTEMMLRYIDTADCVFHVPCISSRVDKEISYARKKDIMVFHDILYLEQFLQSRTGRTTKILEDVLDIADTTKDGFMCFCCNTIGHRNVLISMAKKIARSKGINFLLKENILRIGSTIIVFTVELRTLDSFIQHAMRIPKFGVWKDHCNMYDWLPQNGWIDK